MKSRVLVVIALLGALVACTPEPAGPKVLDREATAEDKLPESVGLSGVDLNVEPGSTRLLAIHDDVQYFAARSTTAGTACLIVVPVGLTDRWRVGCAGVVTRDRIVTVSGADGSEATLINDDVDTSRPEYKGLVKIHDNVLVSSR
ncbi:hypothetical protein [Paenarthrobacter sp. JL.01a]|uniref:hypothetical protein n=1 Tax=Paenarthrobacter sp. JL.01a TaxID=2979324 RepID=UPI0021CA9181|nr:hypothetical protein [Paenarthrobacter sp. JL.01a]UXM91475.1 hypothetical protein N5P29_19620 [Paenarthrobacter sp. JL.01a]